MVVCIVFIPAVKGSWPLRRADGVMLQRKAQRGPQRAFGFFVGVSMGHLCDLGQSVILPEPILKMEMRISPWGAFWGSELMHIRYQAFPSTIEKSSQDPVTNLSHQLPSR